MRWVAFVTITCIHLILLGGIASAKITLDRVVVGSAGGTMTNGPIQMDLTLGQPAIGSGRGGEGVPRADLGFWWQVVPVLTGVGESVVPTAFALQQNTPNPFSIRTSITYAIPQGPVPVAIGVYNLQGVLVRMLVRESKSPGTYAITWDGRDDNGRRLEAGVYFTKISAGSFQRTAKTVILK